MWQRSYDGATKEIRDLFVQFECNFLMRFFYGLLLAGHCSGRLLGGNLALLAVMSFIVAQIEFNNFTCSIMLHLQFKL